MKRTLLSIAASVAIASGALADSVSSTNTQAITNNAVNFAFNQFDTGLGTLTGVLVIIDFSTPSGTFRVTNLDENASATANAFYNGIAVTSVGGLGVTYSNSHTIGATPQLPYVVNAGSLQNFTVNSGQSALPGGVAVTNVVSTNFFSAYEGAGNVNFSVLRVADVNVTGADYAVRTSNQTNDTRLIVTYNYTPVGPSPIPEPATVMAGAFLALVGAGTYVRRRNSRATPRS